jgi:hypothetical protein
VKDRVDCGAGPVACRKRGRPRWLLRQDAGPSVYERRRTHKLKSANVIGHEWISNGNDDRGKYVVDVDELQLSAC